jgi:SPP1 family predicted phage head-tail adaptor
MEAGRLRQRVTIQQKSVTRNSYEEEIVTWTDVAEVWAEVAPLVGREYLEARQTQADVSHKVRMRYRSGILEEMRVYFESRALEVVSVINVRELGKELVLMCRERV